MVVRPSCVAPLVAVGGTCVENCPRTKVPIEGQCRRDTQEMGPNMEDDQPMKFAIAIDTKELSNPDLAERPSSDPQLKYFIYRYTYELARLLNCDPERVSVVSISEGVADTVLVHTVFTTVGEGEALEATLERS